MALSFKARRGLSTTAPKTPRTAQLPQLLRQPAGLRTQPRRGDRLMARVVPPEVSVFGVAGLVAGTIALIRHCREIVWGVYTSIASSRRNRGRQYLLGNHAPVQQELHVTDLDVEGTIPAGLEGMYLRAGPNPMMAPVGGYYWSDGDGMLHGVRLADGKACSYANHAVRTTRLLKEKAAGRPIWVKGLLILLLDNVMQQLSMVDHSGGAGVANTAVLYHAKRLMALYEADLPYEICIRSDGTIETLGRLPVTPATEVSPQLPDWSSPVTAHPKIDPVTGEMFIFGYSFNQQPYVRAGMLDADGRMYKQWIVDTPYASMMHDCGLTEHYAVLLHMPITIDPEQMVKHESLPLGFKAELGSRVGLLRRDTAGSVDQPAPVQWFNLPGGFVFHVANSWEDEEGRVHVVTCHFDEFNFHDFKSNIKLPPSHSERPQLTEYVLDPATGQTLAVNTLSEMFVDFPVVHPGRVGYNARYVYCALLEYRSPTPYVSGIAKFDLAMPLGQDACVAHIPYPEECAGGEALFVPRPNSSNWHTPEDDGWLLVYVHDNTSQQSSLNIYDARTMDPTPLARVIMPQRVPFGFHGTFITNEQLEELMTSTDTIPTIPTPPAQPTPQLKRVYSSS